MHDGGHRPMSRTEKILAGLLGVVVVGYFGWGLIDSTLIRPLADRRDRLAVLEESKAGKLSRQIAAAQAGGRVSTAKRRSLPSDPLRAQRLYAQWLQDLAGACGFTGLSVTPKAAPGRTGDEYAAVRAELTGQATAAELESFLRRFREAALLHRVVELKVTSPTADRDADLTVRSLIAEGLALPNAADREELFPRLRLAVDLPADAGELPAEGADRFPEGGGFTVRLGDEFVRVKDAADGRWELDRGTAASAHPAGSFAELLPRLPDDELGDPPVLSETGPFRRPRVFDPALEVTGERRVLRGDGLKLTARATGYDERAGEPRFSLGDAPDGMTLAPDGALTWTPPADLPAGSYTATVTAAVPKPGRTLTETVTVTLADPNTPPTFEPPEPQRVAIGDTLTLRLSATDAQDGDRLTYAFNDAPAGAELAADGTLRWEVPIEVDPGTVTLSVTATDRGDPPLSTELSLPVEVSEDLRPFVKFSGSIARDGTPVAFLRDMANGVSAFVKVGESFDLASVRGRVLEIDRDSLRYRRDDEFYRLRLGQSLSEAVSFDPPPREPVEAVRP